MDRKSCIDCGKEADVRAEKVSMVKISSIETLVTHAIYYDATSEPSFVYLCNHCASSRYGV